MSKSAQRRQASSDAWESKSQEGIELFRRGCIFFEEAQTLSLSHKDLDRNEEERKIVSDTVQMFCNRAIQSLVKSANLLEVALELTPEAYPVYIIIQKNLAAVNNTFGVVLFSIGDFRGAIGIFRSALEIDPTIVHAQRNLAKALNSEALKLYDEGEATKSIETIKAAVDLFKEALDISKIVVWSSSEQAKDEIATVTKNLCATLNNLAVTMDAHGLPVTDTLPLLVDAANLKFDDAAILNKHALDAADRGFWTEALEMIEQACAINPFEKSVWDNCTVIIDAMHEAEHGDLVGEHHNH